MCSNCGSKISVSYNMTVRDLLNYANANRSSPAAAHGRLDAAIEVLQRNGGCSSCIRELEDTKRGIY